MSDRDEARPGAFRRELLQMLHGYRGDDRFEPRNSDPKVQTSEPVKATRARRPKKSTPKRPRRTIADERPHAGDDEG